MTRLRKVYKLSSYAVYKIFRDRGFTTGQADQIAEQVYPRLAAGETVKRGKVKLQPSGNSVRVYDI